MTRESELLPCPFCGYHATKSKAIRSTKFQREAGYGNWQYGFECAADLECAVSMHGFPTLESALTAWNTRAK